MERNGKGVSRTYALSVWEDDLFEIDIEFIPREGGVGKELLRRDLERSEQNEQGAQIDIFVPVLADTAVCLIGNSRTIAQRVDPHLFLFP